MDIVRKFTLRDGNVTIQRSDGPPCAAWLCMIRQGTSVHGSMAYSARDALRMARRCAGTASVSIAIAAPPPPTLISTASPGDLGAADAHYMHLESALRERVERAREESLALRHLIGTKEPLAALDVLVDQAVKVQRLSLAEFHTKVAERHIEEAMQGQRQLQKELDVLRAQLAAAKPEPEPKPEPAGETAEASPAPVEASEKTETGVAYNFVTREVVWPPEKSLLVAGETEDTAKPPAESSSKANVPGEAAAPTPAQEAQS